MRFSHSDELHFAYALREHGRLREELDAERVRGHGEMTDLDAKRLEVFNDIVTTFGATREEQRVMERMSLTQLLRVRAVCGWVARGGHVVGESRRDLLDVDWRP